MRLVLLTACLIAFGFCAVAEEPVVNRGLKRDLPLKVEGAKVATPEDVDRVVSQALLDRLRGLSAYERTEGISLYHLGYDIPGFAAKGDQIWQAHLISMVPKLHTLRGIMWIHPQTGKVHFVTGYWDEDKKQGRQ